MKEDCFYRFLEEMEKGKILSALQTLVPTPETRYDTHVSQEKEGIQIASNYVDATVFGTIFLTMLTNVRLQEFLKSRGLSNSFPNTMEILKFESDLFKLLTIESTQHSSEQISDQFRIKLGKAPEIYRETILKRSLSLQEWGKFKKNKYEVARLIEKPHYLYVFPWHLFTYQKLCPPLNPNNEAIPLLFLKPFNNINLDSLKGHPAIYIFETVSDFFHLLQFKEITSSLIDPYHLLYFLEFYPNEQLKIQPWASLSEKPIVPIIEVHSSIKDKIPMFLKVFKKCLKQTPNQLDQDTELGNWLYQISKNMKYKIEENRLAPSRCIALTEVNIRKEWEDPHKGLPPKEAPKECDSNCFEQKIGALSINHYARKPTKKGKIKLAHIVPQIVDLGHAPSRLLRNLLTHHNQDLFDLLLISTERFTPHVQDYPINTAFSYSSSKRGSQTLANFLHLNIKTFITPEGYPYEETAKAVSSILEKEQVEIGIFHGPDPIHCLAAQQGHLPLRILFEHGTPPTLPCFDIAIVSAEDTLSIYEELFKQLKMQGFALPFALDVRSSWHEPAPTKLELGIPENSFVMTTISLHLETRLSTQMCCAIGEILRRCPETFYAPIGPISRETETKFRTFFKNYGVNDRILFLGSKENPSQWARPLDVYLNEFPFGSCLGILDAMASGKPVVSMYDENGPPQARYGGSYFGIEKTVRSGKIEEYIHLACRLIQDKDFYQDWSRYASQRYEQYTDVQSYIRTFENILLKCYNEK